MRCLLLQYNTYAHFRLSCELPRLPEGLVGQRAAGEGGSSFVVGACRSGVKARATGPSSAATGKEGRGAGPQGRRDDALAGALDRRPAVRAGHSGALAGGRA